MSGFAPRYEDTGAGRMERWTKEAAAASLAGGIIAASGKPHSVEEAEAVFLAVLARLYPAVAAARAGS